MYEQNTGPTAVYRLFDAEDGLLYVGITCQPDLRLKQHSGKSWWPLVHRQTVEWFETRIEARRAERAAIKTESPVYNRQDLARYGTSAAVAYANAAITREARHALDDLALLCTPRRYKSARVSLSVAIMATVTVVMAHPEEYQAAAAEALKAWKERAS